MFIYIRIQSYLTWENIGTFRCLAGPSWSWSYGSWIYNYLCNQYLSPLKLWVRIPFVARWTQYNNMW